MATTKSQEKSASPRRRQPEQVRARILKSAIGVFADAGFEGASTRKIATRAGVSISLLVYHFTSKEGLWEAMMSEIFEQVQGLFEEPSADSRSATDQLATFVERLVRLYAEFPALHRLMSLEGHQQSDRLTWIYNSFLRETSERMIRLIAAGQQEGHVAEGDPARLRLAILAMAAVPFSISAEYELLTNRDPFSPEEIEEIIDLTKRLVIKTPAALQGGKSESPRATSTKFDESIN